MKLSISFINAEDNMNYLHRILLTYFEYSIKDINSYEELTEEEKQIIPKEVFNLITDKNDGKSTSSNL